MQNLNHPLISFSVDANVKLAAVQEFAHVKRKARKCGPSCSCHFCKNTIESTNKTSTSTCTDETDLGIKDLLDEDHGSYYVEASDDDLDTIRKEEMDDDQELKTIMDFVFGQESDVD